MDQINEYQVFQDHGKAQYDPKSRKVSNAPNGYQKIRVHLIFAVKHDGRHKGRMVAGGHLTPDPIESIYSGVVSIRSLRLVIFLAKLNNLEVWGADIGNAYLEARTKEKLYVVAGPEFEELEGHILVIYKALYGLKSSGLRWSQKTHDIMLDMDFSPCKADPCVWLRKAKCATKYEYVAIYVDDLLIACDCASEFIHTFTGCPEPLGKSVTATTFLDAKLLHDLITGRSVTAVLHFSNLTPGDWYSKRQATVENATY